MLQQIAARESLLLGPQRDDLVLLKQDLKNGDISLLGLLNLGPALLLNGAPVDLQLDQRREAVEQFDDLLVLVVELCVQGVYFLRGHLDFVQLVLLELLDHALVVQNQLLDRDVVGFFVDLAVRHGQLLFDGGQPT